MCQVKERLKTPFKTKAGSNEECFSSGAKLWVWINDKLTGDVPIDQSYPLILVLTIQHMLLF